MEIESSVATAAEKRPVCGGSYVSRRSTNTRIPSASPCQLSAIFLSSSSALSRYIENKGSEPSNESDPPSGASFWAVALGVCCQSLDFSMKGVCEGGVQQSNHCAYHCPVPFHGHRYLEHV